MSLWDLNTPPVLYPDAEATPAGWADPITGELLVCITGLSTFKGGNADLARVSIRGNKKVFANGDFIVLEAAFSEPVTFSGGPPTIASTINGNSRTFAYFVDATDLVFGTSDQITSVTISGSMTNYVVGDLLTFTGGGGSSAIAKVLSVTSGAITAINIIDSGSGYVSAPTVAVTSIAGSGAVLTAVLGTVANGVGTNRLFFRYQVAVNETASSSQMVFTTPIGGGATWTTSDSGSGSGATATAVVVQGITSATVTAPGTGYTSVPTVTFSAGGGTGATGVAVLDKGINTITIGAGGTGYTSAPTVGFSGDTGNGDATATAVLATSGSVKSVTVSGSGTSYTNADPVVFTGGGGTGAAGHLNVTTGNVTSITITAGGSGYTSAPTAAPTTGGGSGQTFTSVVGKAVASVTVTAAGTGFLAAPGITFSSGGGSGATALAALMNLQTVKSITVTSPGTGYTGGATVAITGGGGSGATATSAKSGVVGSFTVTNAGVNYWSIPTVVISTGSATGVATVDRGNVISIAVTNGGASYVSAPTVSFTPVAETPTLGFVATGISTSFSVDGVKPTITSAVINESQFGEADSQLAFVTNDFFVVSVICSKPVFVTGFPTIAVTVGSNLRSAIYFTGSSTSALHFVYEIVGGDSATAGNVTTATTVVLTGGSTIKDSPGNNLILTFSAPDCSLVTAN